MNEYDQQTAEHHQQETERRRLEDDHLGTVILAIASAHKLLDNDPDYVKWLESLDD